jgi:hypothetical protein
MLSNSNSIIYEKEKIDDKSKLILQEIGLNFESVEELNGQLIPRDFFMNNVKYFQIKDKINDLKNVFSSSSLTCLHQNASTKQKFPLLNLIRQILSVYYYDMKPIRKCDGYTKDGVKKYKRFFSIVKTK